MFGHLINLFSIAAAGTRTGRGGASCLEFDNFNINIPQFTQCGSAISIHKLDHQLVCFLPFFDIWSRHLAKNLCFYVPLACSLWSVHHLITHRPPIPGRCIFLPKKCILYRCQNWRTLEQPMRMWRAALRSSAYCARQCTQLPYLTIYIDGSHLCRVRWDGCRTLNHGQTPKT